MDDYFDTLETRHPEQREAALMRALPGIVANACRVGSAPRASLGGVDPLTVDSRSALARLPVTRKSDLAASQRRAGRHERFGAYTDLVRGPRLPHVFASPGPIYEPDAARPDYWRIARALHAAGFRPHQLVHNSFSYHMTPGAFMMEAGAHALGCTVFPAGTGQTEQQIAAIGDLLPAGYTGVPSFLRILLERAEAAGSRIDSIRHALVTGEACPPSLTRWFAERGVAVYQCFATADIGLIAYETAAREGMVVDEGVIVEVVRPGTADPVPDGEVGELVVTTLNPDYPLLRFGTGDLTAVLPGACPTGRTNVRIQGWMGRADQMTKVRGMFVGPGQVAEIVRRFPEVKRAKAIVTGSMADDQLTLLVETDSADSGLAERVAHAVREVTKLRGTIERIAPGALPNDGKVIEDRRSYS